MNKSNNNNENAFSSLKRIKSPVYHGISSNIIKSVSEEIFGVFTASVLSYFSKI